jgi:hypothetical protein
MSGAKFHQSPTKESQKMLKESTVSAFEVFSNLSEIPLETSPEPFVEGVKPSPEVRAKSAKEIAKEFGVSDKTVQIWFKAVCAAYPWIDPKTLKTGSGNKIRYTPLCQELIIDYRVVATELSEEDWIVSVHAANPKKLSTSSALLPSTHLPVSPTEVISPSNGDRPKDDGSILSYQRSGALEALLNSRPQLGDTSSPEQNPLVLAIRQKVTAMSNTTVNVQQQIDQARQISADTQDAIQALEDLEVVERAQAKADRHYQLEKQVYARRLELLGVEDAVGKPQAENVQPRSS